MEQKYILKICKFCKWEWNRITILVAKLVLLIATFTKCMSLENSLKSALLRLIIQENTLLVKKIL